MVEILDYVEKYANPKHWILNYSNPAAYRSSSFEEVETKCPYY